MSGEDILLEACFPPAWDRLHSGLCSLQTVVWWCSQGHARVRPLLPPLLHRYHDVILQVMGVDIC